MKRELFKIWSSGIICCFLILAGCGKKDKIDNVPGKGIEFDPANSFIAGTMYYNASERTEPYAICF